MKESLHCQRHVFLLSIFFRMIVCLTVDQAKPIAAPVRNAEKAKHVGTKVSFRTLGNGTVQRIPMRRTKMTLGFLLYALPLFNASTVDLCTCLDD